MEYMDVRIQREEATNAKSMPNGSTLKAIPTPGNTSTRL